MLKIKEAILDRTYLNTAVRSTALMLIAVIAPLTHNQMITGTIVNATLFIAAASLSLESALLIGIMPSLFALYFGTLPPVLAPFVPLIIIANSVLILTFFILGKYKVTANFFLRAVAASIFKFLLLISLSSLLARFMSVKPSAAILSMLSWPQLITALSGGFLALLLVNFAPGIIWRKDLK